VKLNKHKVKGTSKKDDKPDRSVSVPIQ